MQINGDEACDIIDIDEEIVGIPLTAEILEKNGINLEEVGDNGVSTPPKRSNIVWTWSVARAGASSIRTHLKSREYQFRKSI